jgi:hypothetical protein
MWTTIITSAAIAALVSAVFSFVSKCLERKSRIKEMIFQKSFEMAYKQIDIAIELAEKYKKTLITNSPAKMAYDNYIVLQSLWDKGKLPESFMKEWEKGNKEVYEQLQRLYGMSDADLDTYHNDE